MMNKMREVRLKWFKHVKERCTKERYVDEVGELLREMIK